jgi:sugar phosphate isomerase/epimerase
MTGIRIAYDCSTWGRDGFMKSIDELGELCFWGIEASAEIVKQYYDKLYDFRQTLAVRGLHLAAMSDRIELAATAEELEKAAAFAKMVCEFLCINNGCILVLNALRRQSGPAAEDMKHFAEFCNQVGEYSRRLRIKTCILPRLGHLVETRADMERALELADPALVYLCPDTGILAKLGENPVEVVRAHAGRIGHIHFKDVDTQGAAELAEGGTEFFFAELGKGTVDFRAILDVLRNANYKGIITIELDKTRLTPKESAAISKAYMENILGMAVHPRPVPVMAEQPARAPQPEQPPQPPVEPSVPAPEQPQPQQAQPEAAPPQPAEPLPPRLEPAQAGITPEAREERLEEKAFSQTPPVAEPPCEEAVPAAPAEAAPEAAPPETPAPQPAEPVESAECAAPEPPKAAEPPKAPEPPKPAAPERKEEKKEERGFGYGILPDEKE